MFKKKKPQPTPVNAGSRDNDAIIELTEEVVEKAEEDNGVIELVDDVDEDTPAADDKDISFEDKEDERDIGLARTDKMELPDDDATVDPVLPIVGDEGRMGEDRITASAMAESQADEVDEDLALTEDFDLNLLEDDDVVIVDNMQDEMDEGPAGITDDIAGDIKTDEDLFDLKEKVELEFELDDDEDEIIEVSDDDHLLLERDEEIESAPADEDVIMALKDTLKDDDDFVGLADEEPPESEKDEGLLDLDDPMDLEDDDLIIPLDALDSLDTDNEDDIIEITEFDKHYPTADETLLEQTGMLNVSDTEEEDFLELLDIEEDILLEDEDLIGFGDSANRLEGDEVNHLFSAGLEEELRNGVTEPTFNEETLEENHDNDTIKVSFSDALDEEGGIREDAEEVLAASRKSASEASKPALEDEKFDLNFDPGKISQQVNRLDAFLSEDSVPEPESSSSLLGQTEEKDEDNEQRELKARPEADELPPVTPGQIDAAVERVISQKFSGQIEDIIYKVIEKAVSKEINRLKRTLLENDAIDDSP